MQNIFKKTFYIKNISAESDHKITIEPNSTGEALKLVLVSKLEIMKPQAVPNAQVKERE